jgi:hypothetical protein
MWLILRMKLAFKARIFEPNGYKQLTKWFNKGIISLVTLSFKISRFWNFHMIYSSNCTNEHIVA